MTNASRVWLGSLIASWMFFFIWELKITRRLDEKKISVVAVAADSKSWLTEEKTNPAALPEDILAQAVKRKIAEDTQKQINEWQEGERRRTEKALSDPLHLELLSSSLRLQFDGEYGELFNRLQLPPEKLQQLQAYLVDRRMTEMDVGARSSGLSFEQQTTIRTQAKREIEAEIEAKLGRDVLNELVSYEQSVVPRVEVARINQRLSYAATPLTKEQAIALEQIVATVQRATSSGTASGKSSDPSRPNFSYDDVLALARDSLTDQQNAALASLFNEQKRLAALNEKTQAR